MEEDCRPLGSEGHDVVDVDDDATSVTDSELSVASSSHRHQLDHQREILTSPPETTTHEIDKKRTKKTAQKKCPATKKSPSKPAAKKKKKTTTTTKTTGQTVTSHVDHAAETAGDSGSESSCGLEASVEQVADRFAQGCECRDGDSCFSNINPESAYRHRLNIAELTRSEHDMYLMGVTMASLSNPEETARRTERKRLHTQYVFQGKKICLEAFLYLENCTQYQLKRIRKHIMTHGVTPRVHGNHGKRPHNRFSLDIYQQATAFLQSYIQRAQNKQSGRNNQPTNKTKGKERSAAVVLPPDINYKTVHSAYKEYMEHFEPGTKWLGFSTFRHFMKRQFPLVKFSSPATIPSASEPLHSPSYGGTSSGASSEPKHLEQPPPVVTTDRVVVVVAEDSAVCQKTAPVAAPAPATPPSPAEEEEDVPLECRPAPV
ncbi:uncharacterized protein LOC124201338 [Daphnia pulex]|uniref:uncharacterized protein LOC124201338 n=1 Tax=Daphnia pulex TaxID=6669 RepID=UPI001EDE87FE|nr:uncharacterized protein LOC124201338 [Daphnia pulex]XP_046453706.1 uncharacterized protein LOC124201338 [Daphnia pulex]XP_046453707.1 uncharacterized protein LOC124201338 [Daphnia pulex]